MNSGCSESNAGVSKAGVSKESVCPPRRPSHPTAIASGVRSAQRSRQLCARFRRPPTNQRVQGTPSEESSTRSYGVENSIPRSCTTASQNQAMSSTERRRSSSGVEIPWARMNRVTLADSTSSSDGLHAIAIASRSLRSRFLGTLANDMAQETPRPEAPRSGRLTRVLVAVAAVLSLFVAAAGGAGIALYEQADSAVPRG